MKGKSKITILGSYNTDMMSYTPHLPAAGETIIGGPFRISPGGKGYNQGVAAKMASSDTDIVMISKIGSDPFSDFAVSNFQKYGINLDYVYQDKENATGVAMILVEEKSAENVIVVSPGACAHIETDEIELAKEEIISSTVFLTQLEMNIETTCHGIELAYRNHVPVILNPAPFHRLDESVYEMVDVFTPNETEAEMFSGIKTDTADGVAKAADFFRKKGVRAVIITLGKKGAYLSSDEFTGIIPSIPAGDAVDTTGAGDAFNGGFAVALSEGKGIREAAVFASAVAALSVTKAGAAPSMPDRSSVDELLKEREER